MSENINRNITVWCPPKHSSSKTLFMVTADKDIEVVRFGISYKVDGLSKSKVGTIKPKTQWVQRYNSAERWCVFSNFTRYGLSTAPTFKLYHQSELSQEPMSKKSK